MENAEAPTRARPRSSWAWSAVAAGASGGLLLLAFWPVNWPWAAWAALVPVLALLPRMPPLGALVWGTLLGLVFFRFGLGWMYGIYGPFGTIFILVVAVLTGVVLRLVRQAMRHLGPSAMLWVMPLAWTGLEILRSEGLPRVRFSHLVLGYSQIHWPWMAQAASIGGVYLLSLLVVAFNAALAYAIIRRRWRAAIPAGAVAASALLLAALGQPQSYADRPELTVAAVQEERRDYRLFADWARQAAEEPHRAKIIVLPEHTITETTETDEGLPLVDKLEATARSAGAWVCVGAHTTPDTVNLRDPAERARMLRDPRRREEFLRQCWYDNAALLIGPRGTIVGKQLKAVPVPFLQDGNPAWRQESFATPSGRIGMYVCYDESFTDVIRRLVDSGAEILLGPVLNAHHWPLAQRMQQADMTPMRAIETRRCMVRAASSGVSQIIDAAGQVRAHRLQQDGPGLLVDRAYFNNERTFFVRAGWLLTPAVAWSLLIGAPALTLWDWAARLLRWRRRKA